jgi:Zn/Cd-binding protein ZinT
VLYISSILFIKKYKKALRKRHSVQVLFISNWSMAVRVYIVFYGGRRGENLIAAMAEYPTVYPWIFRAAN